MKNGKELIMTVFLMVILALSGCNNGSSGSDDKKAAPWCRYLNKQCTDPGTSATVTLNVNECFDFSTGTKQATCDGTGTMDVRFYHYTGDGGHDPSFQSPLKGTAQEYDAYSGNFWDGLDFFICTIANPDNPCNDPNKTDFSDGTDVSVWEDFTMYVKTREGKIAVVYFELCPENDPAGVCTIRYVYPFGTYQF